MKKAAHILTALFLPILIPILSIQSGYWAGVTLPLSLLIAIVLATLSSSSWSFALIEFSSKRKSALAWAIYVPYMPIAIFYGSIGTFCGNGDCF